MTPRAGRRDEGDQPDRIGRSLRQVVRAAQWHRRLLAAGLLAGSMAFALNELAPAPPPTVGVLTATRDLAAGEQVSEDAVSVVRRAEAAVPDGALTTLAQARGATLTSAVRSGEVLTDVRLVGSAGLAVGHEAAAGDGLVATPVRIADADAVALLRPGDVVDVLAAGAEPDGTTGAARLVAAATRVLAVPRRDDGFSATSDGALVVLATTDATAVRLAGAAVAERLSVVLRPS